MQRVIPDPGFAGDDGSADPSLVRTLAAHAAGETSYAEALMAVQDARLLVPVVAVLGEVEVDDQGLAHDKTSDMAAVLIERGDGRRGLLAFTGTAALEAWNPAARPVPVPVRAAALSAVQEGASALVVDIAGPARIVVEGEDLRALAAGWRLVRAGGRSGWIGPSTP